MNCQERNENTLKTNRPIFVGTIIAALSVLLTAAVFSMIPAVLAGQVIRLDAFTISNGISIAFNVDPAGMVFACSTSMLWFLITVYSIGYLKRADRKSRICCLAASPICLAAVTGLCFAANLITFFILFELMAAAAYPLFMTCDDQDGRRPWLRYIIYMIPSSLVFLAVIIALYPSAGVIVFTSGGCLTEEMFGSLSPSAVFFLLIFAGSVTAGVIPFHSWIISARTASAPASAFLQAAAVMNAGAFFIFRVIMFVYGPELAKTCGGTSILAWFAALTIIISSLIAIAKTDIMAKITYTTMCQLAFIILGICTSTPFSIAGALYHFTAHGFAKAVLIMSAGAVLLETHSPEIMDLAYIGRTKPVTMGAFAAASTAAAGFPLFAGFISQANIIYGAVTAGKPLFIAAVIAGSLLTIANLIPAVMIAFRKPDDDIEYIRSGMTDMFMLVPIIAACIILIILGAAPNLGLHLFDMALMSGNSIFTPLM